MLALLCLGTPNSAWADSPTPSEAPHSRASGDVQIQDERDNCRSWYTPWDPDQGAAAAGSYCWTPYRALQHQVLLLCDIGGWSWSPWTYNYQESWTTCVFGSGASGASLNLIY